MVGFVDSFCFGCLEGGKQAIIATTGHFLLKFVIEQTKTVIFPTFLLRRSIWILPKKDEKTDDLSWFKVTSKESPN